MGATASWPPPAGDQIEQRPALEAGDRGRRVEFYSTGDKQGVENMKRSRREVRNAGGAGDAFLAGLAYAWLEDWPLSKTLRFALAAADITLSHAATSSPALSLTAVNRAVKAQSG